MPKVSSPAPGGAWTPPANTYYTIIALCGGGFRGLLSAQLLNNIVSGLPSEGDAPTASYPSLIADTCMLAGTSTGADIAGMLVCQNPQINNGQGLTPVDVVAYFQNKEADFFLKPLHSAPAPPSGPPPAMVPDQPNYSVTEVAIGASELHNTSGSSDPHDWQIPKLSSFSKNLALTSFQVGSPAYWTVPAVAGGASIEMPPIPWGPILFHNVALDSADAPAAFPPTPDARIVDAVVSSSAMPGMLGAYYPPFPDGTVPGNLPGVSLGHVDGAFLAHDPTLAAIGLAVASGVPLEQIVVLSIGAGRTSAYLPDTRGWGAAQWMGTTPPAAGYGSLTPFLLGGVVSPMVSMALNGTTTLLTSQIAQLLLGERYCCLSPILEPFPTEADSTTETQAQLLQAANNEPLLPTAIEFVRRYWANSCGPAPVAQSAMAQPAASLAPSA